MGFAEKGGGKSPVAQMKLICGMLFSAHSFKDNCWIEATQSLLEEAKNSF